MDLNELKNLNMDDLKAKILAFADKKTLIKIGISLGSIIIFLIIYYAILNPIVKQKRAQITDMNQPIGSHIGNALEVVESIQVLQGKGTSDTRNLVVMQAGKLMQLSGYCATFKEGKIRIEEVLDNGKALEKFIDMCVAQGTPLGVAQQLASEPESVLGKANKTTAITCDSSGFIQDIDAMALAEVARELGAHHISGPTEYLDKFHSDLQLPPKVLGRAHEIWDATKQDLAWQGKKPSGVAGVLLYRAAADVGSNRTQSEVCKVCGVSEVTLRGLLKILNERVAA